MIPELRADFETRSDVDLKTAGAAPYFASPHWDALILCYSIDGGSVYKWTKGQPCPEDLKQHIENGGYIRAHNASFERQCFEQMHLRYGWPLPAIDRYRCTAAEAAAMSLPRSLDGVGEALGLPIKKDKRGMALIRKFSMPRQPTAEIKRRDTELLLLAEARKNRLEELNADTELDDVDKEYTIDEAIAYYDRAEDDLREHHDKIIFGAPMWNEPEDFPTEFAEFVAYCRQDVLTEAEAAKRIIPLSDYEQNLYTLDQVINTRGIRIDIASATAAINLAEKSKAFLDKEMKEATGGFVSKCSEPGKLVEWVQLQGIPMDSAAKAEVTELLESDDLPAHVRKAIEIRQEAAKTSVAKLKAMVARASEDGRVRGSFLMYGAGTGRWTNMGVNFANMPRPRKIYEDAHLDTGALFDAFKHESPELLKTLYGPDLGRPLHLISDSIRGFVWAAPGHDLIQADYTSIEGAVIAWSSGETWKTDAMFEIMADPALPDLYRRTAAQIMGLTTDIVTKKHPLRQSVGKVSELALGFAGGVSAFYSMSKAYGVKLDALYEPVWAAADEERREKAVKRYEGVVKRGKEASDTLSREAWIASEIIKVGWRATNPAIAAGWKLREEAVREAILNPGMKTTALKFSYIVSRGFLWCMLPSGRCLAYGSPKLKDQVWAAVKLEDGSWSDAEVMDREEAERLEAKGLARIDGATSPKITALGVNAVTKKWERFALYGGLLAENDTQATARDLLVNGMLKAEEHGYPVIAHVYDEIIAEIPHGYGSLDEFERIICELPSWGVGIPLSASGWRGKRYRKD